MRIAPTLVLMAAVVACAGDGDGPGGEPPGIQTETVVQDLEVPWGVAFAGGQTYVTERDSGHVLEIGDDGSATVVHTFAVDASAEAGLLGLAASPYAEGILYAYYTSVEDNRIVRFRPGAEEEAILTGIPKASIHDGGRIAFGPDGKLWVGTGDATQQDLAQDPDSLAGKVLRLEADGTVPEDNPRRESPVWSLGHRNVQGLTWDADGRLYVTEFGPGRDDEINRITRGGNYGWPEVTGRADEKRFVDPIFVRQPGEASWSGSVIPDVSQVPEWDGRIVAASLRGERLWVLDPDTEDAQAFFEGRFGRLRLATQAPDGSLWVLTGNRDGRGSPAPDDDRIIRVTSG